MTTSIYGIAVSQYENPSDVCMMIKRRSLLIAVTNSLPVRDVKVIQVVANPLSHHLTCVSHL